MDANTAVADAGAWWARKHSGTVMAQAAAGAAGTIHRSSEEKPEVGGGGGLAGQEGEVGWLPGGERRWKERKRKGQGREIERDGGKGGRSGRRGQGGEKNIQHDAA